VGFYNVINPLSMQAGQPEDVSQVLANFNAIAGVLNRAVDNSNVAVAAAIARSKLDFGSGLVNADIASAAAIAASKLAGYPTNLAKVLAGDGSWVGGAGLVGEQVLGSNGQLVVSIPTTYRHLLCFASMRASTSSTIATARMRLSGNSTTNYNDLYVLAANSALSTAPSHGTQTSMHAGDVPDNNLSSANFSSSVYFLPNANVSGQYHGMIGMCYVDGAASTVDRIQVFGGSFWGDTNPVSQIWIWSSSAGNVFVAGSRLTVYGFGT